MKMNFPIFHIWYWFHWLTRIDLVSMKFVHFGLPGTNNQWLWLLLPWSYPKCLYDKNNLYIELVKVTFIYWYNLIINVIIIITIITVIIIIIITTTTIILIIIIHIQMVLSKSFSKSLKISRLRKTNALLGFMPFRLLIENGSWIRMKIVKDFVRMYHSSR